VQQTAFSTNLRQQLFKVWSSRGFLAIKRWDPSGTFTVFAPMMLC
jgi:hypothetical protein